MQLCWTGWWISNGLYVKRQQVTKAFSNKLFARPIRSLTRESMGDWTPMTQTKQLK